MALLQTQILLLIALLFASAPAWGAQSNGCISASVSVGNPEYNTVEPSVAITATLARASSAVSTANYKIWASSVDGNQVWSTGASTLLADFSSFGSPITVTQNPLMAFFKAGSYTITITATSPQCTGGVIATTSVLIKDTPKNAVPEIPVPVAVIVALFVIGIIARSRK